MLINAFLDYYKVGFKRWRAIIVQPWVRSCEGPHRNVSIYGTMYVVTRVF